MERPQPAHAVTLDDVRGALERIRPYVHRTPVMTSRIIDRLAGRQVVFKCENLQRVGAFKMRGAVNAVRQLCDGAASREDAARGVVTHSSGNFAQALALAARQQGIPAHIVMPSNAPDAKREATAGYGATIHPCVPTLEARETTAAAVIAETGGTFVHPYDHPHVIAGQGTCALELLEQAPGLDAVVAPVGGGGLMSGICIATRGVAPDALLVGAEPAGADDAARSLAAGELLPQTDPRTIADGLRTGLGELTWPILRDHLAAIVTVDEAAIVTAMRMLMSRMKLVVEPSAAVALAAVLSDQFRALDDGARASGARRLDRVGVVLSGGNVDLDRLPWGA